MQKEEKREKIFVYINPEQGLKDHILFFAVTLGRGMEWKTGSRRVPHDLFYMLLYCFNLLTKA